MKLEIRVVLKNFLNTNNEKMTCEKDLGEENSEPGEKKGL